MTYQRKWKKFICRRGEEEAFGLKVDSENKNAVSCGPMGLSDSIIDASRALANGDIKVDKISGGKCAFSFELKGADFKLTLTAMGYVVSQTSKLSRLCW